MQPSDVPISFGFWFDYKPACCILVAHTIKADDKIEKEADKYHESSVVCDLIFALSGSGASERLLEMLSIAKEKPAYRSTGRESVSRKIGYDPCIIVYSAQKKSRKTVMFAYGKKEMFMIDLKTS